MKLIVKRTSMYASRKPCKEAKHGKIMSVDRRTFKTPEEHDKKLGAPFWLERGTNHRIEHGGIARDTGLEDCWYVEFPDLDALMKFIEKYGECVISSDKIEIYDDYRE